jgi:hypothetical protein
MKTAALCAGILLAAAANAQTPTRAPVIGRHLQANSGGAPGLICDLGAHARFKIMSQNGSCAPHLTVQ